MSSGCDPSYSSSGEPHKLPLDGSPCGSPHVQASDTSSICCGFTCKGVAANGLHDVGTRSKCCRRKRKQVERDFVIAAANRYVAQQVAANEQVWSSRVVCVHSAQCSLPSFELSASGVDTLPGWAPVLPCQLAAHQSPVVHVGRDHMLSSSRWLHCP